MLFYCLLPFNLSDEMSDSFSILFPSMCYWRRQWHPTPVLLPGESHAEKPGGLQSMGSLGVGHN